MEGTPLAVANGILRRAQSDLKQAQEKSMGSRARILLGMASGKEFSGDTLICEPDGAWIIKSGSDQVMINPLWVASSKLLT